MGDLFFCFVKDGSSACKDIFGANPRAIILTRPESDLNFLRFLRGKEQTLHRLASRDLEQRASLGSDTTRAIESLGDVRLRVCRTILCEIIHRCFHLLYHNARHNHVAFDTSWEQLMAETTSFILSLKLDAAVLERFSVTPEILEAIDPAPKTWVELALYLVVVDKDITAERLAEALAFHRTVSDQAAGHLALLADNTFRTPWLAAKILSSDKMAARAAAGALSKHIATTRPANRTHFEAHVFDSAPLWENLVQFSEADPPVVVWHGHGKFQCLFKFLAPRFLLAPDHVLDAERVHARWQWACLIKRGLRMHGLNAMLRLCHFMENNAVFPSDEILFEHLQAEMQQHRVDLRAAAEEGVVARGWRPPASKKTAKICIRYQGSWPGGSWTFLGLPPHLIYPLLICSSSSSPSSSSALVAREARGPAATAVLVMNRGSCCLL